jgi:hypothetical protein
MNGSRGDLFQPFCEVPEKLGASGRFVEGGNNFDQSS